MNKEKILEEAKRILESKQQDKKGLRSLGILCGSKWDNTSGAITVLSELISFIDVWNNSPKLSSSGNPFHIRYKPEIIRVLSGLRNSWFKFVITSNTDWDEIKTDFIEPGLIHKSQVVLMPLGWDRNELTLHRESVVDLAIRENVRYTTREHVVIWNKMTGV